MGGITATPIFPTRRQPSHSFASERGNFLLPFRESNTHSPSNFKEVCLEACPEFWTLRAFMSMDFLPAKFPLDEEEDGEALFPNPCINQGKLGG